MCYTVFMKGEGLTNEFIDIYNYYGYTVVLCSYQHDNTGFTDCLP